MDSCILISDEEDDSVILADVSVQVVAEIPAQTRQQSPPLILTQTTSSQPSGPDSTESPPPVISTSECSSSPPNTFPHLLLSPTPSTPPQIASPTTSASPCLAWPTSSSPPLISTPSPSPPPPPRKSSQPTKVSPQKTKLSTQRAHAAKLAREEAKRLKLQEAEKEKLFRLAKRQNGVTKQNENCIAKIDKNVFEILHDPDEEHFTTLFTESGLNYEISQTDACNRVSWTYKHIKVEDSQLVTEFCDSNWVIVVIDARNYLNKILTYKEKPDDKESLKSFVCDQLNSNSRNSESNVILLVFRLGETLRTERLKEAKEFQKKFKDRFEVPSAVQQQVPNNSILSIGPQELQDLRLTLEIDIRYHNPNWKMHIEFHEKTIDAVNSIVKYTHSIARANREQADLSKLGVDWAIEADKDKAFDPTRSAEDLKKLWIKQLQQFTSITLPIANAIAAEYPSPLALIDQYKNLNREDGETLLAQLYVQRNYKRQIGQDISRRIYRFMTSSDPNVHIAFGDEYTSKETNGD